MNANQIVEINIVIVKSLELHHQLENIKCFMKYFSFISFNHVYRELNMEAYTLSKLVKFIVCLHFEILLDWIQFCWVVLSSWMLGLLVFTKYNFNYGDHILIVRSPISLTQLFVIYKVVFLTKKKLLLQRIQISLYSMLYKQGFLEYKKSLY